MSDIKKDGLPNWVYIVIAITGVISPIAINYFASQSELHKVNVQVQAQVEATVQQSVDSKLKSFIATLESDNQLLRQENKMLTAQNRDLNFKIMALESEVETLKRSVDRITKEKRETQDFLKYQNFPSWVKRCPEGDTPAVMVFINEAFTAAYGITSRQYVGYTDFDVHPEDVAESYAANDKLVCETNRDVVTIEPALIDGKYTDVRVHKYSFPLLNGGRGVAGIAINCDCDQL